jgi:hypothetical protein
MSLNCDLKSIRQKRCRKIEKDRVINDTGPGYSLIVEVKKKKKK